MTRGLERRISKAESEVETKRANYDDGGDRGKACDGQTLAVADEIEELFVAAGARRDAGCKPTGGEPMTETQRIQVAAIFGQATRIRGRDLV